MRFPRFNFGVVIGLGLSCLCVSTIPVFADGPVYTDIDTCIELQAISENLSGNYRLIASFSCDGVDFEQVGLDGDPFIGTFNGNNFTVSDLTIDGGADPNIGLFGATNGATIQNLRLSNLNIAGGDQVGGLVGDARETTIINVSADDVTISGENYIAGIAGFTMGSTMSGVYVTNGDMSGTYEIGGLVGRLRDSQLLNAYFTGSVTGDIWVGGLVGDQFTVDGPNTITNAYANATVEGNGSLGGISGAMLAGDEACSLTNVFFVGTIVGPGGGLAGQMEEDCFIENSAYNKTASTPALCVAGDDSVGLDECNLVNDNESFFYYKTNEPLASWDFLGVWKAASTFPVFEWQTDTTAPAAPGGLTAASSGDDITLQWTIPVYGDYASATLRRSTSAFPATISAGDAVVSDSTGTSVVDIDRGFGTYYYSIFSKDETGNVSEAGVLIVNHSEPASTAQSGGGRRGSPGRGGAAQTLNGPRSTNTTHPAASVNLGQESMSSNMQTRTCDRVMKWFRNDAKMLGRVNERLEKRFNFTCAR